MKREPTKFERARATYVVTISLLGRGEVVRRLAVGASETRRALRQAVRDAGGTLRLDETCPLEALDGIEYEIPNPAVRRRGPVYVVRAELFSAPLYRSAAA